MVPADPHDEPAAAPGDDRRRPRPDGARRRRPRLAVLGDPLADPAVRRRRRRRSTTTPTCCCAPRTCRRCTRRTPTCTCSPPTRSPPGGASASARSCSRSTRWRPSTSTSRADFVLAEALDRHLAGAQPMKIAVTCIQLIRDLDQHRPPARGGRAVESSVPVIAGQHLEGDELVAALDGCVGVIAGDDRFTADVLDRCPDLRVISKWGIGIDGIDLAAAAARGITVTNTPGVFDDEVADVAMAYLVMLARGLHLIDRGVHAGSWPKPAGTSLRGATLGIVGLGGIGRAVAVRAAAAGMIVVRHRPVARVGGRRHGARRVRRPVRRPARRQRLRVGELPAHRRDVPPVRRRGLRPDEARRLPRQHRPRRRRRRPTPSSPPSTSGTLAGAALDVMEDEPPAPGQPAARARPTSIFGSHNASNTLQASARVHVMAIDNLRRELGVTRDAMSADAAACPRHRRPRRHRPGDGGGVPCRRLVGHRHRPAVTRRRGFVPEFIVVDVADDELPARLLATRLARTSASTGSSTTPPSSPTCPSPRPPTRCGTR